MTPDRQSTLPALEAIIRRLLSPGGCPWDRAQTLTSIQPFLLEEAHEVVDALDSQDPRQIREELGDLLFQILFVVVKADLALDEVIQGISDKLIRRHPHVFADGTATLVPDVLQTWERIKDQERGGARPALDGIPRSMPPLARACQLAARAARSGFDWPDAGAAWGKVDEEFQELQQAESPDERAAELGDLLFALVVWGQKDGHDVEAALRGANRRFEGRFTRMASQIAEQGSTLATARLDDLLAAWRAAKS